MQAGFFSRRAVIPLIAVAVMTAAAVTVPAATGASGAFAGAGPGGSAAGGAQAGATSASMFRGEPTHRGVYETAGVDMLGTVAWRFETDAAVRSSAALLDGTLYVGSSDRYLYAIDSASGTEVWRFAAGAAITSSPAVDGERVFFGDRDHTIYALARGDGALLWKVATGADLPLPWGHEGWDYFTASPTLAGGLVLIGGGDGNLYALDARDGSERWRFETGARIRTTPAVARDTVVFGNSAGILYALGLSDGAQRWSFETAGHTLSAAEVGFDRRQIHSSPAVHDGVVYFGSRDANVYAVDLAGGGELWRSGDGTSAWVISSPAVAGGRVFSARSSSGNARGIDATDGSEMWRVDTGSPVFSSPVVVGDTVYLGNQAGWVMALDAADGSERWRYRTGGGVWTTPVVADGRLYVGSDDGFLYAFERTEGRQPKPAVFSEEDVPFSILDLNDTHQRVRGYFERYGYEVLSAATLADFFRARIDDGAPSVVVFAVDHMPADVIEEPLEEALYRRYLDAGGKIVWLGAPPLFYEFDADTGQVTGVNDEMATAVMGVDTTDYHTDLYPVRPTEAGRRWGLRSPWVGNGGFERADVSEVLAVDELGRVVCWARAFGGPVGTGFVYARPSSDHATLDEIRAVAEYGVMRTPPRQRE